MHEWKDWEVKFIVQKYGSNKMTSIETAVALNKRLIKYGISRTPDAVRRKYNRLSGREIEKYLK